MFAGSHFCIPVLLAGTYDLQYRRKHGEECFSKLDYFLIGSCGVLPDILSPHILLSDRMSSWTHNIWFLIAVSVVALAAASVFRRKRALTAFCWAGINLHVFCDMISGGVGFFYPLNTLAMGEYFVKPVFWLPLDLLMITATLLFFWFMKNFIKLPEKQPA